MCGSNDERQVCGTLLENLRSPGTRITFGPMCARFMWQHVIRYHLSPRRLSTEHIGELSRPMHLVRPNGLPWSREWDFIVLPRIARSLEAKARDAVSKGMVSEAQCTRTWAPWARGFLSPDWDGIDFSENYGRHLLEDMNSEEAMSPASSPLVGAAAHEGTDDRFPDDGGLPEDEPDLDPANNVDQQLAEDRDGGASTTIDGLAALSTVVPDDSVSCVGARRHESRDRPHPGLHTIAEEAEERPAPATAHSVASDEAYWTTVPLAQLKQLVTEGTLRLFQYHVFIVRLCLTTPPSDAPYTSVDPHPGPMATAATSAEDAEVEAILTAVRAEREELIQQLCLLDDLIDDRMREAYGVDGTTTGPSASHWPLTGLIWRHFLWCEEEESAALVRRAERTRVEMLEGLGEQQNPVEIE